MANAADPPAVPDDILEPAPGLVQSTVGKSLESRPVGGVGDSPALTRKARDAALIARVDARIRRKATDIVLAAMRAPELAELPELPPGAVPEGWTKRQIRVAQDATNSMKAAPAYLSMAARVVESYKAADKEKAPQVVINAERVEVAQQFNYPVRDLEE